MTCPLCERPTRDESFRIATLDRCEVVLGENQGCRGWCVLVLREHVEHLDELSLDAQREVFGEVARVARAIRVVFAGAGAGGGPPRINYECLGNQVAHVHWHVIPRHADDPDPRSPVWGWDAARLRGDMDDAARAALALRLRVALAGV
ncbi:MAG: HIT family protein [Planctomycetota bacterium]|nr:HIT family protein [Planctomycetota bacterium]